MLKSRAEVDGECCADAGGRSQCYRASQYGFRRRLWPTVGFERRGFLLCFLAVERFQQTEHVGIIFQHVGCKFESVFAGYLCDNPQIWRPCDKKYSFRSQSHYFAVFYGSRISLSWQKNHCFNEKHDFLCEDKWNKKGVSTPFMQSTKSFQRIAQMDE